MLSLFLFALDKISILVGELAAKNLDKVNKVPDAEQTCRQRIKNTRADLADIVQTYPPYCALPYRVMDKIVHYSKMSNALEKP